MRNVAARGDDEVARRVVGIVVLAHVRRLEAAHGLAVAQHGTAERMRGKHRVCEQVVDVFVGRVLVTRDLLDDNLALEVNRVLHKARVDDHVGENLERFGQVPVDDAGVEARALTRREGVELGAHRVERRRDVERASGGRPLEEHMLHEMRHAVEARNLVPGACINPKAECNGVHGTHMLRDDGDAVVQNGLVAVHKPPVRSWCHK